MINKYFKIILFFIFCCFVEIVCVFAASECLNSGIRATIEFNTNGGNSIHSVNLIAPTTDKLPIPERGSDTFLGWYYDEGLTNKVTSEYIEDVEYSGTSDENGCAITPNVTLYAAWASVGEPPEAPIEGGFFRINYVTNGGNAIDSDSVCIGCAPSDEALPIPTRDGYKFLGWYYNENLTDKVTAEHLDDVIYSYETKSVTLYAKWEEKVVADNPHTGAFINLSVVVLAIFVAVVCYISFLNFNKFKKI